jgi:glycine betaine catabolism B
MNILRPIDSLVDGLTMYRLLLYYLIGLLLAAVGLSITGGLRYDTVAIIGSPLILVAACWSINKAFAFIFNAPTNTESSLITALILALVITPDLSGSGVMFLLAASGLAMASKYILAINRKHVFNPAAIAIFLTAIGPGQTASWWISSSVLLPFVIIGGVLLARKLRNMLLLLCFFIFTIVATVAWSLPAGGEVGFTLQHAVLNSPMFFLGFVMLTEPLTAPSTTRMKVVYGGIVAALLPPPAHFFGYYTSPELALVIGNIFSYLVSPKTKLFPVLKQKVHVAADTIDFIFDPGQTLAYSPGQYIEMTLPHTHSDSRGDRRYFTLASSPTEEDIRLGVKFYESGSSFKEAMLAMNRRSQSVIARVSGDFILPGDQRQKLAFIAGGIGVTPFRSMTKYMIDRRESRDVVLLYGASDWKHVAYAPVFEAAHRLFGMKTIYALSSQPPQSRVPYAYQPARVTEELICREVPDFQERIFYISGTHAMVADVKRMLRNLNVPTHHIKIDFFPGYV